jgi:hypothetical protein
MEERCRILHGQTAFFVENPWTLQPLDCGYDWRRERSLAGLVVALRTLDV